MEIIINSIENMHNPYIFLIISIISSLIFGIYSLNMKYEITISSLVKISLYCIVVFLCAAAEIFSLSKDTPMKKESFETLWSFSGFPAVLIVNSIVLLIIYLWYIHKNSIKFFNKNKIELNQSFLLGSITTLWYFGLIAITIVAMGLMEELVSLTGPVALLYLLPLIVGLTLAHKSYSWIKSLLKFVVRKNLPERVRTKLIENKED